MSEVKLVRAQAKRARCDIPTFVACAAKKYGSIDVDVEAAKIMRHLKDPAAAREETPIARAVVKLAKLCEAKQRPHEIVRGIS